MKKSLTTFVLISAMTTVFGAETPSMVALNADCDPNPTAPSCIVRNHYNVGLTCNIESRIGITNDSTSQEVLQVESVYIPANRRVRVIGHSNHPGFKFKSITTQAICFQPYTQK